MKGLIVFSPIGCGEKGYARDIAKYKRLPNIIFDGESNGWNPGDPAPDDTLVFTSCAGLDGALDFDEVVQRMIVVREWHRGHFVRRYRRRMLFSHVRYHEEEIARLLLLPEWLQYMRIAFVWSFGWLNPVTRDHLGIR